MKPRPPSIPAVGGQAGLTHLKQQLRSACADRVRARSPAHGEKHRLLHSQGPGQRAGGPAGGGARKERRAFSPCPAPFLGGVDGVWDPKTFPGRPLLGFWGPTPVVPAKPVTCETSGHFCPFS